PSRLVRIMVGIPYFYRRLGYEYAIPTPGERIMDAPVNTALRAGWTAATLEADAVDDVQSAQQLMLNAADVAITHTTDKWRWLLSSPNYRVIRAMSKNETAYARIHQWDDATYVFDIAATSDAGLAAIIAVAGQLANGDVTLQSRPALDHLLDHMGEQATQDYAYYAQINDPIAMLEQLRPVLGRRLAAAPASLPIAGEVVISFYTSSVRFEYDAGTVGPMRPGPPIPAPGAAGGAGIPPDRFAELILGPRGFSAMARTHPDVLARTEAATVMAVLFPPQRVDVQTWVYP
ncbi:MAG: hypothetical protein OEM97_11225, partial [Acidimicrobiia bacterium]|nr:hypothetical protein [Acidimicrobiia bacterium]